MFFILQEYLGAMRFVLMKEEFSWLIDLDKVYRDKCSYVRSFNFEYTCILLVLY
jgi:hypothetical protein